MQHHIAHLISQGRSGNQPDMVTAGKILALPEIAKALNQPYAKYLGHSISTNPPKA